MLYCIFLCILMNPVCRGERERERSSVDFHLMLIHQNQVSCRRWRRCVCAGRRQLPAESLPVAQQPSRRKMDVLPPALLLAELQCIHGTASAAHAGLGTASAAGEILPLSVLGSRAGAGENAFHAILVKAVNSVDYITLVWEQVLWAHSHWWYCSSPPPGS